MNLGLRETWMADVHATDADAQRLWLSTSFGPPLQIGPILPIHRDHAIALLQLLSSQLAAQPEAMWRISKLTYLSFADWQRVPGWENFAAEVPCDGRPQCIRLELLPIFGEARDEHSGPLLLTPSPSESERIGAERDGHFDGFPCFYDQWLFQLARKLGLCAVRPWHPEQYNQRMEVIRIAAQSSLPDLRRRFLLAEISHLSVRFTYFKQDGTRETLWLNVTGWQQANLLEGISQHSIAEEGAPQTGMAWTTESYLISDYSTGVGNEFRGAQADALDREFGLT
jgi:hypothetical protein